MGQKETNIYEDALMDICKKQKLPEKYEKLINALFNKVSVNHTYEIVGVAGRAEKRLVFTYRKTENFPGEELVSDVFNVVEFANEDISLENPLFGKIYLVYHEDLGRWTFSFQVFDELNGINRIMPLSEIEVF